jgi:hypothetical protein
MVIMELIVAIAIIATLLTVSVQMLTALARQFRLSQQRLATLEAAANLMEAVKAMPDEALDPELLGRPEFHDRIEQSLANWRVELKLAPAGSGLPGRRIELILWPQAKTARQAPQPAEPSPSPIRLVAWHYPVAVEEISP